MAIEHVHSVVAVFKRDDRVINVLRFKLKNKGAYLWDLGCIGP